MKRIGLIACFCVMVFCLGACIAYPNNDMNEGAGDAAANNLDPGANNGRDGVSGNNDNGLLDRSPTAGAYGNRFNVTVERMSAKPKLSLEEAKGIALNHAGLGLSEAGFIHVKMEKDDGALVYKLTFVAGETRYHYEIDAGNGGILSYSQRMRKPAPDSSNGC